MSLTQRIESLRQRLDRQRWLTALGWVIASVIAVATLLMVGDYVLRSHDRGLRWLASLTLEAAALVATVRWVWPLVKQPLTSGEVAQDLQQHFPQLGSRLASALEFSEQSEKDSAAGSADLRRAVVVETTTEVEQLTLDAVIDPVPFRRAGWAVGLAVIATAAFALADPSGWATAATRLATPWTNYDWPREHHLEVTEAPSRIARGSSFEATIVDSSSTLPDDLKVFYRDPTSSDSRVDQQPVQFAGEQAIVRREAVQQSFEFRVAGGDDLAMPWQQVEVVDPPKIHGVAIQAEPPLYSGLSPQKVGPEIAVLAGTKLALVAKTNEPIKSAHLAIMPLGASKATVMPISELDSSGLSMQREATTWGEPLESGEPQEATYQLKAKNKEGFVGSSSPSSLRIEPDQPPEVTWQTPAADLFLTAEAVIPVAAVAADNLAVQWIDLVARPANLEDSAKTEPDDVADASSADSSLAETRLRLFSGSEQPPEQPKDMPLVGRAGADRQAGSKDWELKPLELKAGDQWLLTIEAADYRPSVGQTAQSRRLVIITPAELDARIAQQAAGLVRDLERAATQQHSAREGTRELAIERQTGQPVERATTDRISTLSYEQRETASILNEPTRGVAAQAKALAEEIKNNRLERPELSEQLKSIGQALKQLGEGALPDAQRALTDARRSAERLLESPESDAGQSLSEALQTADNSQQQSVEKLESLIDGLAKWSDLQRFAREVQQLQERQEELARQARREAAISAADPNSPERRAAREKLAENQTEISRRFARMQQAMREEVRNAPPEDPSQSEQQQAVGDALAESDERATGGKMQRSSQQLQQGQLGRAAESQQAAAEDLQQMLDTLRDRASGDPEKLAEQLRKEAKKLEALRKHVEQVKDHWRKPTDPERDRLAKKAERLSRKLNRLNASDAASSVANGAEELSPGGEQSQQQPQQEMEQAEQKLADAKKQLQEKIEELENEIAEKLLKQLASKVAGYIERQQAVLEETVQADDAAAESNAQINRETAEQLADEQLTLEAEVAASAEDLSKRAVFELALTKTAEKMATAAERLGSVDTGRQTQQIELAALTRLRHIADALKPPPPPEQPPQPPNEGGGGQGGQPPKPPLIALAELKMLRLMQLGINAETRELEADSAAELLPPAEVAQTAGRIAGEQSKLSALVRELAARNNEQSQNTEP